MRIWERVCQGLNDWQKRSPELIRKMLTENAITPDDRRVRFVTLKAYEKAGGEVRRDLFSKGEDGVFIEDAVLLETLVARKLEKIAKSDRKEAGNGWRPYLRSCMPTGRKCQRRYPLPALLPPEQREEMDSLTQEADALCELDELDDEQQQWRAR